MKKTIAFLAVGLLAQAHADDIQIQMTGNIYANTCVIDRASRNLTVDLGQAVSGSFKDVGDTGEWKGTGAGAGRPTGQNTDCPAGRL